MKGRKDFPWDLLSRSLVILSLFSLWGTAIMSIEDIPTAIWVAIIGAAATIIGTLIANTGSLIGQGRQLKRDGERIEKISADAAEMNPTVVNIEKLAQNQSKDMALLVSDLDHRKRMEAMFPQSASAMSIITSGVNKLQDENLALKLKYENALAEIQSLKSQYLAQFLILNQFSDLTSWTKGEANS